MISPCDEYHHVYEGFWLCSHTRIRESAVSPGSDSSTHKVLPKSNILEVKPFDLAVLDLVEFVMCTLVSRDCVPFCKYIKPGYA